MLPEAPSVEHTEDSITRSDSTYQNDGCLSEYPDIEGSDEVYGNVDGGYGWIIAISLCLIDIPCITMVECWYVPSREQTIILRNAQLLTRSLLASINLQG